MFKKIISNLPFSPALIGQLSFYSHRLRQEELSRRLGLVFVALALVVQSLVVFVPSESANAADDADFINGGVKSVSEILSAYDNNTRNFKDIMNNVGITRANLAAVKFKSFAVGERSTWGLTPHYSAAQGEKELKIYNSDKKVVRSVYYRPLKLGTGCTSCSREGWIGTSSVGWFAIRDTCGNLITEKNFVPKPIVTPKPVVVTPIPVVVPVPVPVPVVTPIYTCNSVKVTKLLRTSFVFTTSLTLENSTYKNVTYTIRNASGTIVDTKTSLTSALLYNQNTVGKYSVQATLNATANNSDVTATSDACKATFEVEAEPIKPPVVVTPIYTCDSLLVTKLSRTSYLFTTSLTLDNSSYNNVTFVIRNSAGNIIDTKTSLTSALLYTQNTVGKYSVQATLNATANNTAVTATSDSCKASFEVEAEPVIPTEPIIIPIEPVQPARCQYNLGLLASDGNCKPCPGNPTIWLSDSTCKPNIIKKKTATNASHNFVDASTTTAVASDQISYTISVENTGLNSESMKLEDNISDILEYSGLIDNGGGQLDAKTGILSWSDITLDPKAKQTRTFSVKIYDVIPSTAQGLSNPTSYDCKITNTFGNSVEINVDCPTPKIVEKVVTQLPHTGPTGNIIFAVIVLSVTTYFYFRTRQLKEEVRLIRKDAIAGTI